MLSTLIIKTLTDKGPIMYLKLGESKNGQYDGIFTPGFTNTFANFDNIYGLYYNYTQVKNIASEYNLAPRKMLYATFSG